MDIVGITAILAIVYVVGGFIYAGSNALIDLNWVYKLFKK